jgi:hypothetical protein
MVYEVETVNGFDLMVNRKSRFLHHTEKAQYYEDNDDHDQNVDPTACLRETWTYVTAEKTEQPQDY